MAGLASNGRALAGSWDPPATRYKGARGAAEFVAKVVVVDEENKLIRVDRQERRARRRKVCPCSSRCRRIQAHGKGGRRRNETQIGGETRGQRLDEDYAGGRRLHEWPGFAGSRLQLNHGLSVLSSRASRERAGESDV